MFNISVSFHASVANWGMITVSNESAGLVIEKKVCEYWYEHDEHVLELDLHNIDISSDPWEVIEEIYERNRREYAA
jgi:hypothetical protein